MAPPHGFDAGNDVTAPSRSAIIGGSAAGHHLLDIEGYSHTKDYLPTGQCIKSRPFTVGAGGTSWRILYYPNGDQPDVSEFISVFLDLDQGVTESVEAQAKFSLLDRTGVPVPSHSQMTKMHKYLCTGNGGFGYRDFINRAWLEDSGHLKNDCFTIRCDVFIPMELRTEERAVDPVFVTVPPYDLHLHLERLLAAKTGADVTFEVGGETFRAHRCILAARSTVFEAELFGQMKESVDTTVIRVDDMEADVFRALLGFMYTDGLPACPAPQQAGMSQHLLVAADRYNLERLKLICEDNLCVHIDTGSVATILALAEQRQCRGLKEACFDFLSSPSTLNAVMATDAFEHLTRSCPAVLKELMSNIAARVH
ncbi:BTB/POZ and MATH domain-containing protein 2-like [Panicum miliaceum]|uniref:BTB/POZ and MATH domain-containing protein 2-like n=1 Tax=Panicum miliaceum TaxID=4540 RepID=A0A3L6TQE1_PANMI|nr:BTB/POZ and MATH domain-containing protein 2-like [Panicum miliaceum]